MCQRFLFYISIGAFASYITNERRQVEPPTRKESAELVDIRARHGQLTPILEEQLERRLRFALARFAGRIRRVSATPENIDGPRGGEDQNCKFVVSLVQSGSIEAEAAAKVLLVRADHEGPL